jgi:very-short-patch-repair endonuclease
VAGQRRNGARGEGDFVVDLVLQGQRRNAGVARRDFVVDRRIGRIAAAQDGVIGRDQLLDAGLGGGAIDHRVSTGRLTVMFRGVYAAGHGAVTPRGWCRAALLAIGSDAVLSHHSAAYLWGLLDPPAAVHVTVARRLRPRTNLVPHTAALSAGERRHAGGLPVTSPIRTLHDLRNDRRIETVLREAQVARIVTRDELAGTRLASLLDATEAQPTRSELERALLRIVAQAGLPRPMANLVVGPHTVDFAWPAHRLIVETDGYHAHGDRHAFERDRARDAELAGLGWTVIRFTWRQLQTEPVRVAVRLAQALSARSPHAPG